MNPLLRFLSAFGGRAEQAALAQAAVVAGTTFQRGLLPRTTRDQAIVTGTTSALSYGVSVALQSGLGVIARRVAGDASAGGPAAERRLALAANTLGAAAGVGLGLVFREQQGERFPRAVVRTLARGLVATTGTAVVVTAVEEAVDRSDGAADGVRFPVALPVGAVAAGGMYYYVHRRIQQALADEGATAVETPEVSARRAVGMAAGVAGGLGVIAVTERGIAHGVGSALQWAVGMDRGLARSIGHLSALGLLGAGVAAAYDRALVGQERGSDAIEAAYSSPPASEYVSGGPRSLIAWEPLSREGRRFVGMALTGAEIDEVLGETGAKNPLRLYAGLESADDPGSRVDLLLDEMLHMGAYDRSTLCIFVPTGSGYINYVAAETLEYLTRGDVASVCVQYSKRPSFMSLDKVALGRFQIRDLVRAVATYVATLPEDRRPRVLVFGESLGAHVSQDAFLHRGVQGLRARGIDAAIWLGTPHASEWRHQVLGEDPLPDDVAEFASPDEMRALGPQRLSSLRYALLTHHEDPIPKFTPRLIAQRPEWLGPEATRPPGVPRETIWTPYGTFLAVGVDLLNAMNIKPGKFRAFAHDYRSDIRPVVEQVFGPALADEQRDRVDAALRQRESEWAQERLIADEVARANEALKAKLADLGDAVGVTPLVVATPKGD